MKAIRILMRSENGNTEHWRCWREVCVWLRSGHTPKTVNVWKLEDGDGYVRVLEETWRDSVPRIHAIAANYDLTCNVS